MQQILQKVCYNEGVYKRANRKLNVKYLWYKSIYLLVLQLHSVIFHVSIIISSSRLCHFLVSFSVTVLSHFMQMKHKMQSQKYFLSVFFWGGVLGPCCCMWAFSSCSEQGYSLECFILSARALGHGASVAGALLP